MEKMHAKIPSVSTKGKLTRRNKMKRKCKNIDLRNYKNLIPAIEDVTFRHLKRYDFRNLLLHFGLKVEDYRLYFLTHDKSLFNDVFEAIAKQCVKEITERKLYLKPVEIRIKMDKSTGKIRQIGKECAMQQIYDYIVRYATKEILDKRIVPQQASSIKGRGQIYGKDMIQSWIRKDVDSLRYAKKHNKRHKRKCKYFVKLDIEKCYPSAKLDRFMALFRKDCANEDLLWLVETLLASHRTNGYSGFMIGSLISQDSVQYMLSFAYRHIKEMHYYRKEKRYRNVEHMLLFMDDTLMIGSNRKQLHSAVKEFIKYLDEVLGFKVKENYQIMDLEEAPIDMMGYVIYYDGHSEIRGRDFVRARRMALRYRSQGDFLTLRQCKRILAYKGYFKYTNSRSVSKKYDLKKIFKYSAKKISVEERRKHGDKKGSEFTSPGNS